MTPGTSSGRIGGDLEAQVRHLAETVRALQDEVRELRAGRPDGVASAEPGHRFSALYIDFTNRFRGSVAEVSAKLAAYLPDAQRVVRTGGVVDVGSGRAEWLTLLREAGIPARGVDRNDAFVGAARARGLDVEHGDAVGYLRQLPPGSVDMVTAFHLIEHLPVEELLALIEAAHLALRSGGCLLLETPNPANLVMGACDFYNDPTHRSPLPAALTQYFVSTQGFENVEVRLLHPKPAAPTATVGDTDDAAISAAVVSALFGPQDYAVLGFKPPGP